MNYENMTAGEWRSNKIPSGVSGGFVVYGAKGEEEIFFADRNVIELFGCNNIEEFRQHTANSFKGMVHPEDLDRVESDIHSQTYSNSGRHDYVRYRIITKQGACRYVEDFGHLLHSDDGSSYYYVFISRVEQAEYEDHASGIHASVNVRKANKLIDSLTGLLNIDAFNEESRVSLLDPKHPSTVIVFDILGLRDINHMLGHDEGNARICSLAESIKSHMPNSSVVYRGDEAELIAVCHARDERSLMDNIMAAANSGKGPVLFGIGSTGYSAVTAVSKDGTLLSALKEAQLDLEIKKMLNVKSYRSHALASLVRALEEVDADTEAHVQRTMKTGLALGRRIGLTDSQLSLLQLLCLLHDIGKIAVPLEILNKPGRLTTEEWAVLRSHPAKGYQIAMSNDELKPLADMILYHHERWDGKGYPAGLAKEEIPLLSRMIAIVDAYDAMVNDRSYRKGMSPERAKKQISDNAGKQFDPYLAAEFLTLLEEDPTLALGSKTDSEEVQVFEQGASDISGDGMTKPVAYSKYFLDYDNVIIEADPSFEALTGYSLDEAVGRMSQFDLIPESERAYYIEQVQRQFIEGDIAYLRHPLQRKDGTVVEVICNGARYFDSSVRAFKSKILVFEVK